MRNSTTGLSIMVLRISLVVLVLAAGSGIASGDDSPSYVLTQDMLNKTLGVLTDLRSKNLPFNIGDGDLDAQIANLEKQPKVARILKKHGLSPREFILTYKATAQIREAQKAQDDWQRILQDPDASPEAKLDATQKLGDSLKNNLFTPEQIELVRRRMPDLETLLTPPK
ncbi:MAG: hypothetical protein ABSF71_19640 [Terriglobia bacterium]